MFRDELAACLGGPRERRKILREIERAEREELGIPSEPLYKLRARAASQRAHIERVSKPTSFPKVVHSSFLRAPRSLRGKGQRSPDGLFDPGQGEDPSQFWLYESHKVTQTTLRSIGNTTNLTPSDIHKTAVCQAVRKKIDALMAIAATKRRCGLVFDIISTSKIINSGIPHEIGAYIYSYIEQNHFDKTSLKFTFVGITDNVNCCAARDVFCRDELLQGKYIGDTKRTFDALDNVHMFAVFPGFRYGSLNKIRDVPRSLSRQNVGAEMPQSPSVGETFLTQLSRPHSVM